MPVNSNQKDLNESYIDALLLQQRFALEKTQISTNLGRVIMFFTFLQTVATIFHLIDDPEIQTYQSFLCFLSPYLLLRVIKSASPIIYLLVISFALLALPAYFAVKALIELSCNRSKFFPPKLFQTLKNDNHLAKQVIYVLFHLALVPVIEIVIICLAKPVKMNSHELSFKLILFNDIIQRVQNDKLYVVLLVISIANIIVYGVFLLMTGLMTYPRRFISTNSLTNDSKLSMFFFIVKRLILGVCLLIGLENNVSHRVALIAAILFINSVTLIVGYILPTYYDMSVYEFFMSLNLVDCFLGALLMFLNVMAYFNLNVWIDSNIMVMLLILAYLIAREFQRWQMNRIISLEKESSSIHLTLLKYNIMFFKLKGSFDGDRLPEKSRDPFLQNTLSKIRNHFMGCICKNCFCNKIRTSQCIYDKKNLRKIELAGVIQETEGFLKVTSKTFFYKYFILNKLKNIAEHNPHNIELLIYVLKVMIYEFNDFSEATWIFEILEEKSMSPFQSFEVKFLKKSIQQILSYQSNHKVINQQFVNVEKFHKIYNTFMSLESGITLVLRTYLKLVTRISKSKFNALKIKEDMEIIHKTLEDIKTIASESKPNIKILTLCFNFVIEFLGDLKLAYDLEKKFKRFISIPEGIAEFDN